MDHSENEDISLKRADSTDKVLKPLYILVVIYLLALLVVIPADKTMTRKQCFLVLLNCIIIESYLCALIQVKINICVVIIFELLMGFSDCLVCKYLLKAPALILKILH